jgi:hypothetical protein
MQRFYLIPITEEMINGTLYRHPKYWVWKFDQDLPLIQGPKGMLAYGFTPFGLLGAPEISQADHDFLAAQPDVYVFPVDIDQPITDPTIDDFFENVNLPTDWLTPATTYRELMRQTAGMFAFNKRYAGIAAAETGERHSIFDTATLNTRLRQMTAQEEEWFYLTVESFGFNRADVNRNSQLRLLVKQAGNYWIGQEFKIGGLVF